MPDEVQQDITTLSSSPESPPETSPPVEQKEQVVFTPPQETPSSAPAPTQEIATEPVPVDPSAAPTPLDAATTPQPTQPVPPTPTVVSLLLQKARQAIHLRRQKKLEKIMKIARTKGKITNDDVEKLLHVSDATATRFLQKLINEGKLRRVGKTSQTHYEPTA